MYVNTPNFPPGYQQPPPPNYQQPNYQQPYHQQQPYEQPYQQPNYQQPYQQQQQPQQIIIVQNESDNNKERCPFCQSSAGFVTETVVGPTLIMMFLLLLCFTGICCFLAYFIEDWYDKNVKCVNCGQVVKALGATD